MVSFKKMFKDFKVEHILGIVGLFFLLAGLYQYSGNKNTFKAGYQDISKDKNVGILKNGNGNKPQQRVRINKPAPQMNKPMSMNKPVSNPSDLLPNDNNSAWSSLNPANNQLKGINLLNPTQVVGINTQGSSLRNANLQVRSEPPNPRTNTNCPWNISTIENDKLRKPLEIGSCA